MHSSNGQYTVKVGYHYWTSHNSIRGEDNEARGWNKLWNLKLPHKVRIFLWRFCKTNILVKKLLRGKGVPNPITCPMCEVGIEHVLHLFFDCPFAKQCWITVGLEFDMREVESGPGWLLKKLSEDTNDNLVRIATVF